MYSHAGFQRACVLHCVDHALHYQLDHLPGWAQPYMCPVTITDIVPALGVPVPVTRLQCSVQHDELAMLPGRGCALHARGARCVVVNCATLEVTTLVTSSDTKNFGELS